jgi:hypothetical protein
MGLFDFQSDYASRVWKTIDVMFPKGKWAEPTDDLAAWWKDACEGLLKKVSSANQNKLEAAKIETGIMEKMDWWSKGTQTRKDIVGALQNDFSRLVQALPLGDLDKESVQRFTDCSFTLLKHLAVGVEADERCNSRNEKNEDAKKQAYLDTLVLMKFNDRAATIKGWTGRLSKDLRFHASDQSKGGPGGTTEASNYFQKMAEYFKDAPSGNSSQRLPVQVADLQGNASFLAVFNPTMIEKFPHAIPEKVALKELGNASKLLERLGTSLLNNTVTPDVKQRTAMETMAYLEALNRVVFGEEPEPDTEAKLSGKALQDKFKEEAAVAVKNIERDRREERWERPK